MCSQDKWCHTECPSMPLQAVEKIQYFIKNVDGFSRCFVLLPPVSIKIYGEESESLKIWNVQQPVKEKLMAAIKRHWLQLINTCVTAQQKIVIQSTNATDGRGPQWSNRTETTQLNYSTYFNYPELMKQHQVVRVNISELETYRRLK